MKSFMSKYKKGIAIVLALCIIATLIPVLTDLPSRPPVLAADANDQKTAAEISNSTGVEVEKILALRENGRSWNEILEYLKGKGGSAEVRDEMDQLLTGEVLGDEDVELLLDAGFTGEEIQQATLIAERVQFQLQEITNSTGTEIVSDVQNVPEAGGTADAEQEALVAYQELEEKFNIKTAITLMLKLKASFGSMEQVMEEYLYSLQMDLNLEDYLADSETYMEKKNDKSLEAGQKEIITMSDIENEMLEAIRRNAGDNEVNEATETNINPSENTDWKADDSPASPFPEIEDVKPQNPGEDILDEIQQINPLEW